MKVEFLKNKGSATVEAAIIAPLVISCVLFVIYLSCLYCQRALLQSVADRAVQAGADTWSDITDDIATGKTDLNNTPMYWRIIDNKKSDKLAKVKKYSEKLLNEKTFLKPNNSEINVRFIDYIAYKRLYVSIENRYEIPGAAFLSIFGVESYIKFKVTSCTNINDPGELIRNTDFLLDIEKELENKYPGLKNVGDKTREVLGKVKDNISKLTK